MIYVFYRRRASLDASEEVLPVGADEGQHAAEHHVGEHAERPHVDCLAVALARQQLGRAVGGRAAARGLPPLLLGREPKVGQLDLSPHTAHQVSSAPSGRRTVWGCTMCGVWA